MSNHRLARRSHGLEIPVLSDTTTDALNVDSSKKESKNLKQQIIIGRYEGLENAEA